MMKLNAEFLGLCAVFCLPSTARKACCFQGSAVPKTWKLASGSLAAGMMEALVP